MYSKNRWVLTLLVLCFAFVSFTPLTAQELILSKVYMKDGNVFIGEITRYESGIITIKTEYGTFNLDDSKVKYITVSESELKESYKEPCIVLKDGKVIPGKVSSYISVLKRVKVRSNYGDIMIDRFKDIALIVLEPVEGKPWLSGWAYRKKITIAGSAGAGTNYQVLLKIGESSGASGADFNLEGLSAKFPSGKNDGGDLRFTASDGVTLQDFWVENVNGTSPNRVAYVWVKVSEDLGTNRDIYVYFGNPNATNQSNVQNTFIREINGVKASWHFDEGLGTTAYDSSGNNNNGRIYGATWIDGKFGKALNFNGSNNYVSIPDNSSLYFYDFTFITWIKTITITGTQYILEKDIIGTGTHDYEWRVDGGKLRLIIGINGINYDVLGNVVVDDEKWHFVVGRRSGNIIEVWVDGSLDNSNTAEKGQVDGAGEPLDISNGWSLPGFFNGIIDELFMFDRALTYTEILDLYNNYGYTTINYPGKVLVRKYASPEPAFSSAGAEEKRN
jgi:hypothetical protein